MCFSRLNMCQLDIFVALLLRRWGVDLTPNRWTLPHIGWAWFGHPIMVSWVSLGKFLIFRWQRCGPCKTLSLLPQKKIILSVHPLGTVTDMPIDGCKCFHKTVFYIVLTSVTMCLSVNGLYKQCMSIQCVFRIICLLFHSLPWVWSSCVMKSDPLCNSGLLCPVCLDTHYEFSSWKC